RLAMRQLDHWNGLAACSRSLFFPRGVARFAGVPLTDPPARHLEMDAPTREIRLNDGSVVRLDEDDFWRFWKEQFFLHNGYVCMRDGGGHIRRLNREVLEVRDSRIVRFLDGDPRSCSRLNLQVLHRSVLARA